MHGWVVVWVAAVVAVVAVVVVEPRPQQQQQQHHQQYKRGVRLCSPRDVKLMATYVCNIHKRTVRSLPPAGDADEGDDAGGDNLVVSGVSSVVLPWQNLPCDAPGVDCGPGFPPAQREREIPHLPPRLIHRLISHSFSTENGGWADEKENGLTSSDDDDYRGYPSNSDFPSSDATSPLSDVDKLYHFLLPSFSKYAGGSSLPHSLPLSSQSSSMYASKEKRDKEMNWPVVVPRSLSAIRQDCCMRECTAEDFFGACS